MLSKAMMIVDQTGRLQSGYHRRKTKAKTKAKPVLAVSLCFTKRTDHV